MPTTFQDKYPADSVSIATTSLGAIASSGTGVAGWESGAISNRTNLDLDHILSGKIEVGTTPTLNSYIQIWVVPATSFTTGTAAWPDVMDGTASAETWTSVGIRDGAAVLAKTILVDATTSNRDYYFGGISVAALFGGNLPPDYVLYITQNTGVNLNATDGNHLLWYTRVQAQAS